MHRRLDLYRNSRIRALRDSRGGRCSRLECEILGGLTIPVHLSGRCCVTVWTRKLLESHDSGSQRTVHTEVSSREIAEVALLVATFR